MKKIEVEVRAFINDEKYKELESYFEKNAKLITEDEQETHYLSGEKDIRIQKNKNYAKIWMKHGQIHDDFREEIEIKTEKENFGELEKLFRALDYSTEIKWFRKRKEYIWEDITVCLDNTKGYGKIIELEKMTNDKQKEQIHEFLKSKLSELKVELTPKEEFKNKYEDYKKNWKTLIL